MAYSQYKKSFLTMSPKHANIPARRRRAGFTLVELLAVVAVIVTLMSLSVVGLNGLSRGKGVPTGVSVAEGVFQEARALAIGNRTTAAVLISAQDYRDRATYLRRMIVVYKEVNAETNVQAKDWSIASRGATLPEGVYFSTVLSKRNHKTGSGSINTMNLTSAKREYSGEYYIYEFNSEGICTTPGASFVIGAGTLPIGSKSPRTVGAAKRDFGGFVIWRNGSTSVFRDPQQVFSSRDNITKF